MAALEIVILVKSQWSEYILANGKIPNQVNNDQRKIFRRRSPKYRIIIVTFNGKNEVLCDERSVFRAVRLQLTQWSLGQTIRKRKNSCLDIEYNVTINPERDTVRCWIKNKKRFQKEIRI